MSKQVVSSQLDGLLWGDQRQVYRGTWEQQIVTVSNKVIIIQNLNNNNKKTFDTLLQHNNNSQLSS